MKLNHPHNRTASTLAPAMPGAINNKNAAKPATQRATTILHLRCKPHDKTKWKHAAAGSLSEWAIGVLNRAAARADRR